MSSVINALKLQQDIFGDDLFLSNLSELNSEIREVVIPKTEIKENIISDNDMKLKSKKSEIDSYEKLICNCQECPLGSTRNKFVYGVGDAETKIMLVGEGPGADEDEQGEPFVGRAGKLLNDILKAIQIERQSVYIANIVKCRPPENRKPTPEEMSKCIPYLHKQIEIIAPKHILCLGTTAAEGLLGLKGLLKNMRLQTYSLMNATVSVTYHPAALLRNPNFKRDCWEDVQKFKKLIDSEGN